MFDKLLSRMKPKSIDKVNPMYELYEELNGNKKTIVISLITSIFLSLFLSGLICQLVEKLLQKRDTIYILNCFIKGATTTLWLTLILVVAISYGEFRVYRSLKKSYVKNYDDNYLKSEKETYGGSHFQTEEELATNFNTYNKIEDTTEKIFGINKSGKICALKFPPGMNKNAMYCGAPGSGKTAAIMKTDIYQIIRNGDSGIITDSKGSLYNETSAIARANGYVVRVLNLKPGEFKNSDGWNLFKNLRADDPSLDSKADVIANIILKNTSDSKHGNDYWLQNTFNALKFGIMIVGTDPSYVKTNRNTLPELFNFFSQSAAVIAGIAKMIPKTSVIRQCYDIFANCKEDNQGQILNGVAIRLSKLSNIYLQHVLSNDEIDTILPMKKKCLYYIIISDTDDAYKFISSLFFTSMINDQCEYFDVLPNELKKKQLKVYYELDEYYATGGVQTLPKCISTLRSRGVGISIILQDVMQLNSMYEESEVSTILTCCTVKGLLSANNLETAKYYSDLLGTQTVMVENLRFYESATDVVHAHDTIQKTMGEGNRPLKLPEELMNDKFSRDDIIYVINGMAPVLLKKYFSEMNGVAIHPLEKAGREFPEKRSNKHKPKWRKKLEEDAKRGVESSYEEEPQNPTNHKQMESNNTDANKYSELTEDDEKQMQLSMTEVGRS